MSVPVFISVGGMKREHFVTVVEEAICSSETQIRAQIHQTLMHELGHYFGMTEEQLRDV